MGAIIIALVVPADVPGSMCRVRRNSPRKALSNTNNKNTGRNKWTSKERQEPERRQRKMENRLRKDSRWVVFQDS